MTSNSRWLAPFLKVKSSTLQSACKQAHKAAEQGPDSEEAAEVPHTAT